ncbi:hypothetical protein [Thermococcus thioreducens]|uniref:Uncharacterized protein n=1 Tax=Thermococcus thioreducens TaxID=277988 RepID=A0A0Q2S7C2_9EURY|nr:hypothetical protein [Thermococcus thioreducens]ASJ13366.1 hypothetical protein A3L14_10960 [Thermococcus thioreducens]KQH83227.1 hypothetical protein AMR53_00650 [Thermococcus thioreducens]SEW23318.1 hypothetical protein SAMN05216170_2300 [Thermococcus thioreducens]
MMSAYLDRFVVQPKEFQIDQPRTHAVGLTRGKNFVYVSADMVHRYISGQTNAGKTTLAQTLMEVDFLRGRKIVEIEPALEAKNERAFMNLPNDDDGMLEVLNKYFHLEPRPFKAIVYSPATRKYRAFMKNDEGIRSKFYKSLKITEPDVVDLILAIFPGGSIERLIINKAYKKYTEEIRPKRKERSISEFLEVFEEVGKEANFSSFTLLKLEYIASVLHSDGKHKIDEILKKKDEISVFTFTFIRDPLERYLWAMAILNIIYDRWEYLKRKEDILSFYVADAHLLAPKKKKDMIDTLARYQERMKQNLQVYSRISRGKGLLWTFDSQEFDDLDDVVVAQCQERFIKRMRNRDVAEKLKIDYTELRRLDKKFAFFDDGYMVKKILVRPPMSRKARSGEFLPIHFVKEYKRWENEEANY